MQPTPENVAFIEKKLSRFRSLPGFPKGKEELTRRATLLCRLVKNRTLLETFGEEVARRYEEHGFTIDTNDLDWLLNVVEETAEQFPTQAALRRMYGRYFTTPDDVMIQAAAADLAGDVW